MAHYPCPDCCGETTACVIYETDFTVADTSTVPDATELSGDWEIVSNALHPDHAASDQRIRFDDAVGLVAEDENGYFEDMGVWVEAVIRGQADDTAGVTLITDADGDTYTDALVTFGTGSDGRFEMHGYANGVLSWSWDASFECSANSYDIAFDTPMTLRMCVRRPFTTEWATWYAVLTIGSDVYRLGYAEHFPTGFDVDGTTYGGLATGTDAITAYFDDFRFLQAGPEFSGGIPDGECEVCPTCYFGVFFEHVSDRTEIISGSWSGLSTSDDNAMLLINEDLCWANDNLHLAVTMLAVEDGEYRIIISYLDTDNYWYLQFGIELLTGATSTYTWELIERSGGVETTHVSGGPRGFFYYLDLWLYVWDCTIAWTHMGPDATGAVWECFDSANLNKTGRWGFGSGTVTTGTLNFASGSGAMFAPYLICSEEFDCDNLPTDSDPPDGDPDPPDPLGCCDPADGIAIDSTVELTISDLNIVPGCVGDPCITDLVTFLLAMNSTHTLTCTQITDGFYFFFLDTGLDPPCESTPSGITMEIRLWIFRDGDVCFARIELWAGSTCIIWLESDDSKELDESCDGFGGNDLAGFGDSEDCCIDITGVSWSLDFS